VRNWLLRESNRVGFELELFDVDREGDLERALDARPAALVWVENPANPTWEVVDIAATADAAHAAGARLVVDATVTTPLICRPIELGADYVLHSATKFLNGHSDVLAGALACARADEHWQRIREVRYHAGAVLGPFEAWLLIRGMRTLHVRLERACLNAMAIARHFDGHPSIRMVRYPGLEGSPGHAIAKAQWNTEIGYGAMVSLCLGRDADASRRFAASTRIFLPATSLGGVESLIEHRLTVEEGTSDVPEDLVRLSVGIEDPDELIADLEEALGG
jgi:cystathionine gamma-synthase